MENKYGQIFSRTIDFSPTSLWKFIKIEKKIIINLGSNNGVKKHHCIIILNICLKVMLNVTKIYVVYMYIYK